MEIVTIGGGPAGSWASILLAKRGHTVTLVDSLAPWEKPCGGGITTKALNRFNIFASDLPRKYVDRIIIFFGDIQSVSVTPEVPLAVVSRHDLGQHLLAEAARAGVRIVRDRVTEIRRVGHAWRVSARESHLQAEFLIGADGATSMVRRTLGKALAPDDLCVTVGYFIPGNGPADMKIFFIPSLEGYIWSFPRPDHISYGLITRSGPGWTSRAKALLSNFIVADLGSDAMEQAEFYSAPVPCLGPRSWKQNVTSGESWALIGDAAGLVDPITGEGIYFAFRSAEILADSIDHANTYAQDMWNELGRELARASHMYKRFYRGRFLGGDFRKRTIQLASRSRTIRHILGDVIAGNQPYANLKKTLFLSAPAVGWDLMTGRR